MLHELVPPLAGDAGDVLAHECQHLGHARVEDDAGVVALEARGGEGPRLRDAVHGDERPHPDARARAHRADLVRQLRHRREEPVRLAPRPARGGVEADRGLPAGVDDRERPVVAGRRRARPRRRSSRGRGRRRCGRRRCTSCCRRRRARPAGSGRVVQQRRRRPAPRRRPTRRPGPRARRRSPPRACGRRARRRGRRSATSSHRLTPSASTCQWARADAPVRTP